MKIRMILIKKIGNLSIYKKERTTKDEKKLKAYSVHLDTPWSKEEASIMVQEFSNLRKADKYVQKNGGSSSVHLIDSARGAGAA